MTVETYHVALVSRVRDDVGETRYQALCSSCGVVGVPQRYESDAWCIAERHAAAQGFERPGGLS